MHTFTEAYGPDPLQEILYTAESSSSQTQDDDLPWVFFIHGGAWRDPRNSYKDSDSLFNRLISKGLISRAASINYRLSPYIQHPTHLEDVLKALTSIIETKKVSSYILVGHSAGAFLALQSLIMCTESQRESLFAKCAAVICAEGIYDLASLVEEYPSYLDFVEPAFGSDTLTWNKASPASGLYTLPFSALGAGLSSSARSGLVIVHSDKDELLSWGQPHKAIDVFKSNPGSCIAVEKVTGMHDEVPASKKLSEIVDKYISKIGS